MRPTLTLLFCTIATLSLNVQANQALDCAAVQVDSAASCSKWCEQDGAASHAFRMQDPQTTNSWDGLVQIPSAYSCECANGNSVTIATKQAAEAHGGSSSRVLTKWCQSEYVFPTCKSVGVNNCNPARKCGEYCETLGFNDDEDDDADAKGDYSFCTRNEIAKPYFTTCHCGLDGTTSLGDRNFTSGLLVCGDDGWDDQYRSGAPSTHMVAGLVAAASASLAAFAF